MRKRQSNGKDCGEHHRHKYARKQAVYTVERDYGNGGNESGHQHGHHTGCLAVGLVFPFHQADFFVLRQWSLHIESQFLMF